MMEKPIDTPYFEDWWNNNKACFLNLPAGWAYYLKVYHQNPIQGIYDPQGRIKDPYTLAKSILDKHLKV